MCTWRENNDNHCISPVDTNHCDPFQKGTILHVTSKQYKKALTKSAVSPHTSPHASCVCDNCNIHTTATTKNTQRRFLILFFNGILSMFCYTLAKLTNAPWASGMFEAACGVAPLCSVLCILSCDKSKRNQLIVLSMIVCTSAMLVSTLALGVALEHGSTIALFANIPHTLVHAYSLVRIYAPRNNDVTITTLPNLNNDATRSVTDMWALIHAVILFVLVASVVPMRRDVFAAFTAAAMPLPLLTVSVRCNNIPLRFFIAALSAFAAVGQIAYGYVIFGVDTAVLVAKDPTSNQFNGDFAITTVRSLIILWYSIVACLPHALWPVAHPLGKRKRLLRLFLFIL